MYPASPGATKNKATRYRYRSRKKRGEGSGAVFSQVYTFLHQFVCSTVNLLSGPHGQRLNYPSRQVGSYSSTRQPFFYNFLLLFICFSLHQKCENVCVLQGSTFFFNVDNLNSACFPITIHI